MAFNLFKRDFNKPGPGVPKNAPRKKGAARFFEILGRDFGNLVKLNLLYALFAILPMVALFIAFLQMGSGNMLMFLLFLLLGVALSIPLGGATTAMYYCISKMLRDEPGFIWHDFKKAIKENFRSSLVVGIVYALLVGLQALAFLYYQAMEGGIGLVMLAIYLFSVLLLAMASPYYFLQAGYLTTGPMGLIRNSFLLALGFAPRSLMGALLGTGLVIAQVLFLPLTLPVMLLIGFTIPGLLCLMWIWPPVDKQFGIEDTLRKRRAAEGGEAGEGFAEAEAAETEETDEAEEAEAQAEPEGGEERVPEEVGVAGA